MDFIVFEMRKMFLLASTMLLATIFASAQTKTTTQVASSINSFCSQAGTDSIVFNPALTYGEVTDVDGNIYKTIIIGSQTWMAENLKTTRFNDSTEIPNVSDSLAWSALDTPAYCWYNNDSATKKAIYGALYNWHTINTGKLPPVGWHVPLQSDWVTLTNYLIANGYNYDGSINNSFYAKSLASAMGWTYSPLPGVVGSTDYQEKRNASGFTALPGGMHNSNGTFSYIGDFGYWWTSTKESDTKAWYYSMYTHSVSMQSAGNATLGYGFSVRCINDSILPLDVKFINKKAGSGLTIYPNPVFNELYISFEAIKAANARIEIADLSGRILLQQTIYSQYGSNHISIPAKQLPSGLYLFRLYLSNTSETIHFIKN
jgi:uncharacterized protein (TIGR02145 family)